LNEDDNNKNRKYPTMDRRVAETYVRESRATNKNALSDPYVKAIRWASDRIGSEGIVAFVTNNSFLKAVAFDGVRRHLARDFSAIVHVDLKGDARTSAERRRQEGGNIFLDAIKVSVGITLLVRKTEKTPYCRISLYQARDYLASEAKGELLDNAGSYSSMKFEPVTLDDSGDWVFGTSGLGYEKHLPIGGKETTRRVEGSRTGTEAVVFRSSSNGLKSNRDMWAYNFDRVSLQANITKTADFYNDEMSRWQRSQDRANVDAFVRYDPASISWSRDLKLDLKRGRNLEFSERKIRRALYRPFTRRSVYFDRLLNEEIYSLTSILPNSDSEEENRLIVISDIGFRSPHAALATNLLPDVHLCGSDAFQCFPFYTYAEDGTNRRENITDWALEQFRARYQDPSITKWDIFHYIYAFLHHPEYRERYAANLRRELPRIPFASSASSSLALSSRAERDRPKDGHAESRDLLSAGTRQCPYGKLSAEAKERVLSDVRAIQDAGEPHPVSQDDARVFRALAKAGQRLAEIHVHYEQQPEYPLTKVEKPGEKLDYRVSKMKLSKDKTSLIYNQFLTLSGIPPETYEYRLGNRSALEWVIDQYQVSTDKRSGITNDPNRTDDPQYILRLVGQVIAVSLETVRIVRALPSLGFSS